MKHCRTNPEQKKLKAIVYNNFSKQIQKISSILKSKTISDQDCKVHYDILKVNSDRLWNSAELLAANGDYGSAVHTGIVSLEELIKGFILLLDSKWFEFRKVKNINVILNKSHAVRHFMLFFIFLLKILTVDLINILRNANSPNFIKDYSENPGKYYAFGFEFVSNKIGEMQNELLWFLELEKQRQHGVHLDIDLSGNSIHTLDSNFEDIFYRLGELRISMNEFMIAFDEPALEAGQELINLRNTFIKEYWYDKLDQELDLLFKKRKNPLKGLQELLLSATTFFNADAKKEMVKLILNREHPELEEKKTKK